MAKLSLALEQGNPGALQLTKSLLATPMLINPGWWSDEKQGVPFAIPLNTEEHSQTGTAQVSESLVIASTQKVNMADNVAPGAWTWNLSGYIPGIAALEMTNFFTPIVYLYTKLLQLAYKKGYILTFKDIDAALYRRVVIQSLTIRTQADCRNSTPFSMVLKEINVISTQNIDMTDSESAASPASGSGLGFALISGVTIAAAAGASAISAVNALTK